MPKTHDNEAKDRGRVLIPIARATISNALGRPYDVTNEGLPWLHEQGASFVTLTQNHNLRGCIGTLDAHRPLLIDVKANARAAAFHDPRFSPLTVHELDSIDIEVSLLSAMQLLVFSGEQEALAQLEPAMDGVVFEYGRHRSTFLPQVWEQLPEIDVFMAHLKHKAGLPPNFWSEEVKLYRYSVTKWKEKDITNEVEILDKKVRP